MNTKISILAGTLACGLGIAAAQAAPGDSKDNAEMQAALAAKVSLAEAVNAAQSSAKGKAVEVVFTDENGKPGYEVTIVTGDGAEKNLFVDAINGKTQIASPAAENENDGNNALDDSEEGESDAD